MSSSNSEWFDIIERLIEREGGYVNHPQDPGGETKWGISKRSYPSLDIRNLTREDARSIYERDFIEKYGLSQCRGVDRREWVLDWVVNTGPYAIKCIQRGLGIKDDGQFGPETASGVNGLQDPKDILRWRMLFFAGLTKHPFIKGWLRRLVALGL